MSTFCSYVDLSLPHVKTLEFTLQLRLLNSEILRFK